MCKEEGGALFINGPFHKKDEAVLGLRRSLTKKAETLYKRGYFNTYLRINLWKIIRLHKKNRGQLMPLKKNEQNAENLSSVEET